MSRRGNPLLAPVRRGRQIGYTVVRRAGDYLPLAELALALLGGNAPEASYWVRAVIRRHVNRWLGAWMGRNLFSGRGGFGAFLRRILGL